MTVTIIGAGIHGLSTAVQAALAGMKVTLLDQGPVPNPLSSSSDAHRLIRHAYGDRHGYAMLVQDAFSAWDRLWERTGTSHYIPTGTLAVGFKGSKWISNSIESLQRMRLPVEPLDAPRLSERFPYVRLDDDDDALYAPGGGVLLADRIMEDLVRLARQSGVDVRENVYVSPSERPDGDQVLWCTGAWTRLPDVIPSRQVVGYLAQPPSWTRPSGASTEQVPMILDLDERGGLYVVPGVKGTPWKIGMHTYSLAGSPDDSRSVHDDELDELSAVYRRRMVHPDGPGPLSGGACWYAVQDDSRFQLREMENGIWFYGGSGHSFKFGALVGEVLAQVLADTRTVDDAFHMLSGQRP